MWRDLRRSEEDIYWEIVATSRFTDSRWSQVGLQTSALLPTWQTMSNILVESQRVLHFVELRSIKVGWASLLADTRHAEGIDPGEGGEFHNLMLSRCMFTGQSC